MCSCCRPCYAQQMCGTAPAHPAAFQAARRFGPAARGSRADLRRAGWDPAAQCGLLQGAKPAVLCPKDRSAAPCVPAASRQTQCSKVRAQQRIMHSWSLSTAALSRSSSSSRVQHSTTSMKPAADGSPTAPVASGMQLPTKAAGCHISGQHDGRLGALELAEHPVTLLLALVAMNGQGGPAVHAQALCCLQGQGRKS